MDDQTPEMTGVVTVNDKEIKLYQLYNIDVETLIPSTYNPNEIDEAGLTALRGSLRQNPKWLIARPVIVNTFPGRENIIVGGEKRWMAAKAEGLAKIPVMFVYDTLEQEKADNERDNIRPGKVNPEKERILLTELRDAGYDMAGIGYTPDQMVSHMNMSSDAEAEATANPDNQGTTPSKEMQCPQCGHVGKKKDFRKKE